MGLELGYDNGVIEQALLASIIMHSKDLDLDEIFKEVYITLFEIQKHRAIFNTLIRMYSLNQKIVLELLCDDKEMKGMVSYLVDICTRLFLEFEFDKDKVNFYINKLKQAEHKRYTENLLRSQYENLIQGEPVDKDKIIDALNVSDFDDQTFKPVETVIEFASKCHNQLSQSKLKFNLKLYQETIITSAGDLNIIAAPSGHGKTRFMMNLIVDILQANDDVRCIYISYESILSKLKKNIINILSIKKGHNLAFNDSELGFDMSVLDKLSPYYDSLSKDGRLIVQENIDLEDIGKGLNYKDNKKTVLFIDYFQILKNQIQSNKAGWEIIKEIARKVEKLAKDKKIIIFAGSQVNENMEAREGKDIYNSAANYITIFNHSHSKLKDADKTKGIYKYIEPINNYSVVSYNLSKARERNTALFQESLLFDGFKFIERSRQEYKPNELSRRDWN